MATHSSILAWRILWTEKPGGCCPWGCTESDTTEATQQQQPQKELLGPFRNVSFMWKLQLDWFYIPTRLKSILNSMSNKAQLNKMLTKSSSSLQQKSLFSLYIVQSVFSGTENYSLIFLIIHDMGLLSSYMTWGSCHHTYMGFLRMRCQTASLTQ